MARFVLKCDPDLDLYVEWSTVIDDWTLSGTRVELLEYLTEHFDAEVAEKMLTRADLTGTSLRFLRPGALYQTGHWSGASLRVGADHRLPRHLLAQYVLLHHDLKEDEAQALLEHMGGVDGVNHA